MKDAESKRLLSDKDRTENWKRWGPYLADRQWGTVREDYSPNGACWDYFPHDHARSRAYRWGEDGLMGFTDRQCRLCFSLALWNGRDPILKERLFGLAGPEGNHGEDVKECYYYLDSTPTHSYVRSLYKYPQKEFPYGWLVDENKKRDHNQPEFELIDTGIFEEGRYFDVFVEYAKNTPNDILIKITVANRGPDTAKIETLPTVWFRNTWAWGRNGEGYTGRPKIFLKTSDSIQTEHETLESFLFCCEKLPGNNFNYPLFTENETNGEKLYNVKSQTKLVKDGFHQYVVNKTSDTVSFKGPGTKACFHSGFEIAAGQEIVLKYRLFAADNPPAERFGKSFDDVFEQRKKECNLFYEQLMPPGTLPQEELVIKQAYAGLLSSKQFYYYSVREWKEGDPSLPPPSPNRKNVRNVEWDHLYNRDVISMPDKWEYPWYAAWDLAFHMISFARIDPAFAKEQLLLFLREWYMHPNGQMPAYEFAFSDVNPPVHAWACLRVYKITAPSGSRDRVFLEKAFHKLLINFTWWVNRKDLTGRNLFSGGFLGLDNIGVFDRSRPVPGGGTLEQADATAWMAFYCAVMLSISLELASFDQAYEDIASKFFEHFVAIVDAINNLGGTGLWNEEDGFYYDQILTDGQVTPLRIKSLVGIIPLLAVEVINNDLVERLPGFEKRSKWFLKHRQDLAKHISYMEKDKNTGSGGHSLLAIASRERLERMLKHVLNEDEFLSPFGIRSLSKSHEKSPFILRTGGEELCVNYVPGESNTTLFGGNSNWRGPVWFPINYLLIEALERFDHFYGDSFKIECPTGSGVMMTLKEVANEIARRLTVPFMANPQDNRPCHGTDSRYENDPHWKDLVLFYEYFHGDSGKGLGASHQTGWTALVTRCFEKVIWERKAKR